MLHKTDTVTEMSCYTPHPRTRPIELSSFYHPPCVALGRSNVEYGRECEPSKSPWRPHRKSKRGEACVCMRERQRERYVHVGGGGGGGEGCKNPTLGVKLRRPRTPHLPRSPWALSLFLSRPLSSWSNLPTHSSTSSSPHHSTSAPLAYPPFCALF